MNQEDEKAILFFFWNVQRTLVKENDLIIEKINKSIAIQTPKLA